MGNSKSRSGQRCCSQFLPEEQAEIDRLFDALSSDESCSSTSPRSFSLKALKARITTSSLRVVGSGERLLGPQWLDCDCDRATIEDWVFRSPHVATFLSVVIHKGLLVLCSSLDLASLVPERQVDQGREFESLLDVLSVIYLDSHLPREWQHRWRLLFSSELHGHSFSQLCGRITHRGPCVALLEDHDGHVFGGFASSSWEVKPQFQGDDRCFLFSISPSMAVYMHTGYNDHYMYLNHGQQTIPNGLCWEQRQLGQDFP
ncbi:PREDICTED: TLD domain-containing protein 1 [Galeopterus variegatus]|uniref:MTOR-associated protein MEAK7 n=1 Tax=Galeopterus variegatus TaxID=482537 RepID=A0ABM0R4Y0_GALVR|nr:PREDICTED: TLD domain-containing protein 1 [Galeopterus variegatus]